jgi:exopolyphosphatase/guanosine-5'-triphosphate,3'-diphosphate pyrophosphatase
MVPTTLQPLRANLCVPGGMEFAMAAFSQLTDTAPVNVSDATSVGEGAMVAAVDLGSNSFHMLVARLEATGFQVIDKLREPVRLAAGLDAGGAIAAIAHERALRCLARFSQRLRGLPGTRVRAVGTDTLREAVNAVQFVRDAEAALGHPIEVISGAEEARLIYTGVVHSLASGQARRLVVDIGGGSTEIIAGYPPQPDLMANLPLGCVTLTEHFFPDRRINGKAWRAALAQAELKIQPHVETFRRQGWQQAVGASGTVLAIRKVLAAAGWADGRVTRDGLRRLVAAVATAENASQLKFKGLSASRRDVFPGGVAILAALFEGLDIERMDVSDAALREGLLLDFVERSGPCDARARSVEALAARFGVDSDQAERVADTAAWLFSQVQDKVPGANACSNYLEWAARLHEVGSTVSHFGRHKYGAYIVENADLMGFSKAEQAFLAALIRSLHGRFQPQTFVAPSSRFTPAVSFLAIVLRLSVLLHRNRLPVSKTGLKVEGDAQGLSLHFPPGWLADHPLTATDLEKEARVLRTAGFALRFG